MLFGATDAPKTLLILRFESVLPLLFPRLKPFTTWLVLDVQVTLVPQSDHHAASHVVEDKGPPLG